MNRQVILAVIIGILVFTAGCISSSSFGTGPEGSGETVAKDGTSHATLLSFERVNSECIDDTGLGANSTTYPTDNGTRIVLNRTIKTNNPDVALNASLSSNDSDPTTWTIHITSHANSTEARTCTGRVQFNAVIAVHTEAYNITIRHNGNRTGNVFRTKHGGGGGSGVAHAPVSTNNTTATTAG
jgi:hypothetical protein